MFSPLFAATHKMFGLLFLPKLALFLYLLHVCKGTKQMLLWHLGEVKNKPFVTS